MYNESSIEKEIWFLGYQALYKGADKHIKWDSEYPNFIDCDILIVDMTTLDKAGLEKHWVRLKNETKNISDMIN